MNKNWTLYLCLGAAVVLLLGAGYVQGLWSERWGSFPELDIFAEQLVAVPHQIGEWEGTDEEATDERILEVAGAEGELVRTYKNAQGVELRISIVTGRLRDVTQHTPDRCYPAAGFDMLNAPQREIVDLPGGGEAQFFASNFTKSEPTGTHGVRGYWSWTGDGTWIAPDNTKLAFGGQHSALYKLYVFASIPNEQKRTGERDIAQQFIAQFIPVLNEALRPAFERVGRVEAATSTAPAPAPAAAPAPAG